LHLFIDGQHLTRNGVASIGCDEHRKRGNVARVDEALDGLDRQCVLALVLQRWTADFGPARQYVFDATACYGTRR
jgi:hypothetical protein